MNRTSFLFFFTPWIYLSSADSCDNMQGGEEEKTKHLGLFASVIKVLWYVVGA